MNPKKVTAIRAWFFGERKLNILQIYGGFKGKRRDKSLRDQSSSMINRAAIKLSVNIFK